MRQLTRPVTAGLMIGLVLALVMPAGALAVRKPTTPERRAIVAATHAQVDNKLQIRKVGVSTVNSRYSVVVGFDPRVGTGIVIMKRGPRGWRVVAGPGTNDVGCGSSVPAAVRKDLSKSEASVGVRCS